LPRIRLGALVRCSLAVWLCCAAAASASTSTAPNPLLSFTSPGTKQVSLQVCNSGGCTTVVHTVVVLDPNPAVTSLSATPGTVTAGGVVHLTGAGSGQPPLTYGWRIFNAVGGQVATLSGATADWTANVIFIVVIGGIGTIEGPIIGVIIFWLMQTYLSDFGTWYLILLGALAILIMLFAPRGIFGLIGDKSGFVLFPLRRRLRTPAERRAPGQRGRA